MQAVTETPDTIALKAIHELTLQQAKTQLSAADAAMRVLNNFGIPAPVMNRDGQNLAADELNESF